MLVCIIIATNRSRRDVEDGLSTSQWGTLFPRGRQFIFHKFCDRLNCDPLMGSRRVNEAHAFHHTMHIIHPTNYYTSRNEQHHLSEEYLPGIAYSTKIQPIVLNRDEIIKVEFDPHGRYDFAGSSLENRPKVQIPSRTAPVRNNGLDSHFWLSPTRMVSYYSHWQWYTEPETRKAANQSTGYDTTWHILESPRYLGCRWREYPETIVWRPGSRRLQVCQQFVHHDPRPTVFFWNFTL